MIDPRLVSQTADLVEQHPDAVVEDEPVGIVDATIAEMDRRKANKHSQDVMNGGLIPRDQAANEDGDDNPLGFMRPDRPIGAAAQGALQGGSMMFADELAGVGNVIADSAIDPFTVDVGKSYAAGRDPVREDFKTAQKEHPIATTAGMFGGGLLSPIKAPVGGPGVSAAVKGAQLGSIAGIGANEDPNRISQDIDEGGGIGGLLGAAGGKLSELGMSAMEGVSNKADDLLAAALNIPVGSDDYILFKNSGMFDKVLNVVRSNAEAPYTAGGIRNNIEGAYQGMEGSLTGVPTRTPAQSYTAMNKPGSGIPAPSRAQKPGNWASKGREIPPQDIADTVVGDAANPDEAAMLNASDPYEAATTGQLNSIKKPYASADANLAPKGNPSNPPTPGPSFSSPLRGARMPEEAQIASQKLGDITKRTGSGLQAKNGLQATTLPSAIAGTLMSRGEMIGGVGFSKIANKMAELLQTSDMASGMSQVGTGKLKQLLDAVKNSDNPELEDYLAKEMDSNYNQLSLVAKDAVEKESK